MTCAPEACRRSQEILDSITDAIGLTPCVRLHRFRRNHALRCDVVAKCEFLNPGGSIKDRVARQMILDAEADGRLSAGDRLVEATSGNAGIGLSMVAAARGYGLTVTMPEKMSHEKEVTLRALGASVVRTPTDLPHSHPESLIGVASRMEAKEGYVWLNQYTNASNAKAHYDGTGQEIYEQCGGKVDMVVMGVGTGGTITGVAKKLKKLLPHVIVVGVDPVGSILADPDHTTPCPYHVEGIGYNFVPKVCKRRVVDRWVKCTDAASFELAAELHREEGLLVGGSSGSAMLGVLQAASELREGQRCVVVLPDGIRNYMSKFIDPNWCIENGLSQGVITRPTYEALFRQVEELRRKLDE